MDFKQIITEHYQQRSFEGELGEGSLQGHMVNRSCGDEIRLFADLEPGFADGRHDSSRGEQSGGYASVNGDQMVTLKHLRYKGQGCSICIASADILCSELEGLELNQAREHARALIASLDFADQESALKAESGLKGHMYSLTQLRQFPMRQKCATMSWKIFLDITSDKNTITG